MRQYAELHCKTNFSFLTGGSHADELVARAMQLGYHSLAITDENSLAGIVRAYSAARESDFRLIVGAEIVPNDAPPVVLWAPNRKAYGDLSKLITVGRRRAPKGECWLRFDDIAQHAGELIAGVIPSIRGTPTRNHHLDQDHASYEWFQHSKTQSPRDYRDVFGDDAFLLAELYRGVDDQARLIELQEKSTDWNLPLVAAGDVLYHCRSRMPLHDILTCIKHRTTIQESEPLLLPNAERHLQPVEDRFQAFASVPESLENNLEIARRCQFRMNELRYEYPTELAPDGTTPMEFLRKLTWEGADERFPQGIPDKVRAQINHELTLIEELKYESFFLTVWDVCRFAAEKEILHQGRGSAANSAVCYCLKVTAVDPSQTDLLFERFVSKERHEAPDIDVDFENKRRDEVLAYLYDKYGKERAGIAATVITYRTRSAIRDVGKALGLSLDRIDSLAKHIEGHHGSDAEETYHSADIDPESDIGKRMVHLVNEIKGFPRHLGQHVGGMVISRGPLTELVPIENTRKMDRSVIQWDKNDLEELGLLKVDCLCLGMLTAIQKSFQMLAHEYNLPLTLASVPKEDRQVYEMICEADTVGVFQIESRGQMSMLPRLRPQNWYDLVIEVAIVRPGPIVGNMVHPYLKRRNKEELPSYPTPEIEAVLKKTLGVPLFQEQAMSLCIVAAGFTPGEADQLRRAMATFRHSGKVELFREKLMRGMKDRGLSREFAEQVFNQINGFGSYGFPESHAASFAHLVYISAWLKRHYPAVFTCSILNSYPMGFYAPPQLVADVKRTRSEDYPGVVVLPVDVNCSHWDCTLEFPTPTGESEPQAAIRLGMRMVSGLSSPEGEQIEASRKEGGLFKSMHDFSKRTGLGKATLTRLSNADAFSSLNQNRRQALWQALAQDDKPKDQPLFANLDIEDEWAPLPELSAQEEVFADYRHLGLSLKNHPMAFCREPLERQGVIPATKLSDVANGASVAVAGIVVIRQRPSTAKGITFVTLEDETGIVNLIVKAPVWKRFYKIARASTAWLAYGKLQSHQGVLHVVVGRLVDLSPQVADLKTKSRNFH